MRTRRPARRTEARTPNTRRLFCRSAVVLGRPRRPEPPRPEGGPLRLNVRLTGRGGSGRQGRPRTTALRQKSLRVLGGWGFCSTGAAEDDRAPTEELSCISGWGAFVRRGARGFAYTSHTLNRDLVERWHDKTDASRTLIRPTHKSATTEIADYICVRRCCLNPERSLDD